MTWLAGELIAEIAPRLGLHVHVEPAHGYVGQVTAEDGRKWYFRNSTLGSNSHGAAEIARDKAYCAYFLRRLGYPVPAGETFYSDDWRRAIGSERDSAAAYAYARSLGFPVVVKPNSRSNGIGVAKVHSRRELNRALRNVFGSARDHVALLQPVVPGDDYRLVVFAGKVHAAYRRLPLSVVGDGRSTLADLLAQRREALRLAGRRVAPFAEDYRVEMRLARLRFSLDSIPSAGQVVAMRDNANLSDGGDAEDVTDYVHAGYRELAVRATRDMGLQFCGVDLLTGGPIDEPPRDCVILELNASPGLDHYARLGENQRQRIARLYEDILREMIGR